MPMYILYRIAHAIILILPVRFSYWLASRIADIHYYTSKKDRRLLIDNLKNVFGKVDKKTKRAARAVIRNFGKYLVDFLRVERMGREYIEKHVKVEGIDNLKGALEANKGVLAFSAHLGNWEWGAAIIAQLGFPISVIALAHKDKNVNSFFINQRTIKGVKSIPVGGSVRKSLELLAKNEVIGILPDRDFSNNSIPVNFFGKRSFMPVGIGILAIKSGCALVPTFVTREKNNTHKLILEKPLEYNLTKNKDVDIKNILQKTTETIEKYVRLYPEQWFMFDGPWRGQS